MPPPTGVVSGPLMETRRSRAALTVSSGSHELNCRNAFSPAKTSNHLIDRLPAYARPLFLRMRRKFETTATFKSTKTDLVREGYDTSTTRDLIYFNDPDRKALVPMDRILFDRIQQGNVRL